VLCLFIIGDSRKLNYSGKKLGKVPRSREKERKASTFWKKRNSHLHYLVWFLRVRYIIPCNVTSSLLPSTSTLQCFGLWEKLKLIFSWYMKNKKYKKQAISHLSDLWYSLTRFLCPLDFYGVAQIYSFPHFILSSFPLFICIIYSACQFACVWDSIRLLSSVVLSSVVCNFLDDFDCDPGVATALHLTEFCSFADAAVSFRPGILNHCVQPLPDCGWVLLPSQGWLDHAVS